MKTLTQQGYKIIDSSNDCANYAKVNDDGTVTVETLYRYGRPVVKTYTKNEFNAWREDIKRTETNETVKITPVSECSIGMKNLLSGLEDALNGKEVA